MKFGNTGEGIMEHHCVKEHAEYGNTTHGIEHAVFLFHIETKADNHIHRHHGTCHCKEQPQHGRYLKIILKGTKKLPKNTAAGIISNSK